MHLLDGINTNYALLYLAVSFNAMNIFIFDLFLMIVNTNHYTFYSTGDTETDEAKSSTVTDGRGISRGEKSHLIVWQVQLPLKKGDSIFLPEDIVR